MDVSSRRLESIAENLNAACINFNPSMTLNPGSIFLIDQAEDRRGVAERSLRRAAGNDITKWFLLGHRGSGKSTFLKRLLASDAVSENYFPILFRISEVVDMSDLDYQELLFAVATKLVNFAEDKEALSTTMKKRLEVWGRTVIEEYEKEQKASAEVEGGVGALFAKFLVKLQTQSTTKKQFRQQIEPQITELIGIIDSIADDIKTKLGKPPLIAIDDIDKATVLAAKNLFGVHWTSVSNPQCYVIFTVPVSLMHELEWQNIKDNCWTVPNINIYYKSDRQRINESGAALVREFISKRMNIELITPESLNKVVIYGGGVLRQICSIIQIAADHAEARNALYIEISDVDYAISEQISSILPQITEADLEVLAKVSEDNDSQIPFANPRLLHNQSLLLYSDSVPWHDVNPLLWSRVDEFRHKSLPRQ